MGIQGLGLEKKGRGEREVYRKSGLNPLWMSGVKSANFQLKMSLKKQSPELDTVEDIEGNPVSKTTTK